MQFKDYTHHKHYLLCVFKIEIENKIMRCSKVAMLSCKKSKGL